MMPGPEGANSSSGVIAVAPAPPPPPAPVPHHPDGNFVDRQQPAYPSLAYPSAGPSQPPPPQHFPQQQQQQQAWGFNPYYNYGPHHGGPPQRPQPNGGGGFQPGFHPGYQSYPFPAHYYPPYGQMPVPGPGPGTMQNGYYVGNGFQGFPGGVEPPNGGGEDNGGGFHPNVPFQHQPYGYPPGHPYAYGGGVGYQQPMPYGGYRPDGFIPDHHQHPMHLPSKGLNPAAQGFQYQGRKLEQHVMNGHTPNGDAPSVSSATSEIIAPVPEKPGLGGSLGLSLELAPEPEPVRVVEKEAPAEVVAVEQPPKGEVTTPHDEGKTGEQASEPASEAPEPIQPVARAEAVDSAPVVKPEESKVDKPATVKAEEPKQDAPKGLTFTGASLAGVASPTSSAPSRRPRVFTHDPIRIRPCRPSPEVQGNSYDSHLANRVPRSVAVERIEGAQRRRSTKGHGKPKGNAVLAVGVKGGRTPPAITLVFGTLTSAPTTPVITPTPAIASPTPPPTGPALPKAKPSSWASLFGGPKPSASAGPSSTLVSPSKTNVSLPSEAPETPRSAVHSLPPSTGPAPAKPRPAFNYAAAAAVGAPLSPAEDLARLLTEGLRTRPVRPSQPIIPRGLINTGNMCFANTILQVLRYCTPFTDLFEELGKRLKADLARRTPLLEAMIIFLREFVPGPSANGGISSGASTPKGKSRDDAFIPENVYDAMKENKRFDSMRRGYQEDAEEYLGFFLNTLHEELLGLYSRTKPPTSANKVAQANGHAERTIGRPVSPGTGDDGDDWLEVGKKQKTHVVRAAEAHESAVSRIFGGTLRSVLHAPGQKDSVTLEPYQPLQLDVQSNQVVTLVDALKHLNEPEIVPGVWVQARGANVDATKQVFFESFPQVLILHLKRFVYDPQEQNVVKRSKPVAYGTELVIPNEIISPPKRTQQPVKYRLFGVVYHHGYSATGGHYTVAVSRPDGTGWLHFDDEAVAPVPADDVVVSEDEARSARAGLIGGRERCAYLLFYQRVR